MRYIPFIAPIIPLMTAAREVAFSMVLPASLVMTRRCNRVRIGFPKSFDRQLEQGLLLDSGAVWAELDDRFREVLPLLPSVILIYPSLDITVKQCAKDCRATRKAPTVD